MQTPVQTNFRDDFQKRVFDWTRDTFGEVAVTPHERARRFLEEALELAQAEGVVLEEVRNLANHVYAKPPGDPKSEVGGIGITLFAYCESKRFSAARAFRDEFDRVLKLPAEHFRARHNRKADAGVAVRVKRYDGEAF